MEQGGQSDVRDRLREAIEAAPSHTATSLAKAIGRDGTYLRDFLNRKKRTIGASEIDQLESILKISLRAGGVQQARPPEQSSVELALDAPSAASQAGRVRDVPELGIAVGGSDGDFSLNGETIGYVPRPLSLMKRDVFAVRVRSDSMSPRFEEGDLLYVERHRQPAIGDDGVFEMQPEEEGRAGSAFIKRLVSKNMHTVVVRQFNPPDEITYERRKLKAMYRVVPNNELLGV